LLRILLVTKKKENLPCISRPRRIVNANDKIPAPYKDPARVRCKRKMGKG